MENDNRLKIIEDLKKAANEVKEITNDYRKRRPIVIEFSGSPKAGKTSCINSLKQFLKRNGFEVEVIQERASVCPVYDKHSPMFNIWTACTSISGLLGILENKKISCDVVILDRGIFDALCWFEWLSKQDKMDESSRKVIDDFLLMNEFVNKIDIVFSFCVNPDISIKREYANLLTDELGTIMNEKVLSEYLLAIDETIQKKSQYFNAVKRIDTSIGNQDEISKEVTSATLEILRDLFIEKIGHVNMEPDLKSIILKNKIGEINLIHKFLSKIKFEGREVVESSDKWLQPIPVAVISNREKDKILVVKKNNKSVSAGSPEKDKLLLYVGGHTRKEDVPKGKDVDVLQIYRETLHREIAEEIGISVSLENINPIYIYGDELNDKSRRHIAICFHVITDIDVLKLRLDSHELVQNKGTTKSGKFFAINEILECKNELEEWSRAILDYFFEVDVKTNGQLSVFDMEE